MKTNVLSPPFEVRSSGVKLLACFAIAKSLAFGQGGSGTITGTLTDPAGAVIPGATVEATNTQTGVILHRGNQHRGRLHDLKSAGWCVLGHGDGSRLQAVHSLEPGPCGDPGLEGRHRS